MLTVPLSPIPSQTLQVVLDGQNVQLSIYQLPIKTYLPGLGFASNAPLFMDISLNGTVIATCRSCKNLVRVLLTDQYSALVGDFIFVDTQGSTNPVYAGLGGSSARYQLLYLEASDLAAAA